MRHPVVLELDRFHGVAAEEPQAVVGIGELRTRAYPREHGGQFQDAAPQDGHLLRRPGQEARAEDDREVFRQGLVPHRNDVFASMLAVGVESREESPVRLGQEELESCLKGGALPEIDRMVDHDRAGRFRESGGGVLGAVVDADDSGEDPSHLGDDFADDFLLVVEGDDHPRVLGRQHAVSIS